MLAAVLSVFALALAAPWITRAARGATGWVLAVLPAGLAVYFASWAGAVAAGNPSAVAYPWVPGLGINLSFYLDGLSLLFALLITGIGALVLVFAGGYLAGHPHLGRFFGFILLFMASMLGLVLADNVITLFVFWELTSLSSYLLIGFEHRRPEARGAALQALLVTSTGGLALLVGLLLLGQAGGSLELTALLGQGAAVRAHPLYAAILGLVLAGAFTKSAQFPFHFWLPSAMEAPTPVSAYLHSATMVKAGVYLLARLHPVLGETALWVGLVAGAGAVTMLVGGALALVQRDMKRILAYSTVSALGTLTLLLGLGSKQAATAAAAFLLGHALYKGALFLMAGTVDHEAGTRDIERLGGLARAMPVTAAAAGMAALSMAGLPPLFGFIGKELLFEAVAEAHGGALLLTSAAVASAMLLVAASAMVGVRPFLGPPAATPKKAHEGPVGLWLGPVVLAGAGLVFGIAPGVAGKLLVAPAAGAVLGEPAAVKLALWHGWNPILALSGVALLGGWRLYLSRGAARRLADSAAPAHRWGPAGWYAASLRGLNAVAGGQTRFLQSGYLRSYLLIIISSAVALIGVTLVGRAGLREPGAWTDVRFWELAVAVLILLAALLAVRSRSRIGAIVALGTVGYGVALVFVLFGAPDLAMTQVLIETLSVILLVLVFYHLPRFAILSSRPARLRDAVVALAAGGLMTALVLEALWVASPRRLSQFFAEHSLTAAHGRNIVNVILVDFRALDTLGEITVLAVAGVGVFALLKLRLGEWPRKGADR